MSVDVYSESTKKGSNFGKMVISSIGDLRDSNHLGQSHMTDNPLKTVSVDGDSDDYYTGSLIQSPGGRMDVSSRLI